MEKPKNDVKLIGKWYGYPDCCIHEFCKYPQFPPSEERKKAGNGSGLIPCAKHAKAINEGTITLQSLINNRSDPRPFLK